jgi:hypothetical protein
MAASSSSEVTPPSILISPLAVHIFHAYTRMTAAITPAKTPTRKLCQNRSMVSPAYGNRPQD